MHLNGGLVSGFAGARGLTAIVPATAGSIRSRPSLLSSFVLPLVSGQTRPPALRHAPHVLEELGCGIDASDQHLITRTGAGDVQQVVLGVVDFFQLSLVAGRLDPLLQPGRVSSSDRASRPSR